MKAPHINLVEQPEAQRLLKVGKVVDVRIDGVIERGTDGDAKVIDFVITDGSEDRYGDTIDPAGWEMDNFVKNPVLLWAHDYRTAPVGKLLEPRIVGKKVKAKVGEWVPREISEFAWMVEQMVRQGFLNAVSVGFRPLEWEYVSPESYSIAYTSQELLEVSVVPVPANPNALVAAKSAGLWGASMDEWLTKTLDEKTAPAPVLLLAERAFKVVRGQTVQTPARSPGEGDEGPALPEVLELRDALKAHTAALEANTAAVKGFTAAVEKAMAPAPEPEVQIVRTPAPPAEPTPAPIARATSADVSKIVALTAERLAAKRS